MKDIVKADSLIPFLNQKNKTDIKYGKDSVIERKELFINKVESVNEEDGTVYCTITTTDVDRAGDIVLSDGCDTEEFKKIPSVFLNHDYSALPIARCEELIHQGKSITAKVKFALNVPAVKDIFELVKFGALKGVSIGFSANEVIMKGTKAFDDVCKKIGVVGDAYDKVRRIIKSWTMYEFSLCSIPCNPSCTTKAVEEVKVEEVVKPLETVEEVIKSLETIAEILEKPAEVVPEVKEIIEEPKTVQTVTTTITKVGDVSETVIVEVPIEKAQTVEEFIKLQKNKAVEEDDEPIPHDCIYERNEVKTEVKEEPIEIIPHVKRYIQVIQTPEEKQEYIDACVQARIRGKSRIKIV